MPHVHTEQKARLESQILALILGIKSLYYFCHLVTFSKIV